MIHTNRTITALLALCLIASLSAAACSTSSDTPAADTTDAVTEAQNTVETDAETESPYKLGLPDDLDYGGEEIFIYGWEHYEDIEFFAEAEIGEVVNDAVFHRNLNVQENLNVKLAFSEENGRSGDSAWEKKVRNANQAGDAAYDIVAGHSHCIGGLTKSMDLLNLLDYDYLDLDQPWWRSELTEHALIRNKLYFATGDISPSSVSRSQGIFVNTQILSDFDLPDPYQLVVDGTWTHAKMMEMSKGIYADLNADGKPDEAGDRFGFASDGVQLQAVGVTSGIVSIEQDTDGNLVVSDTYITERSTAIADTWIDFMHKNQDTVKIAKTDDATVFRTGRSLFYAFPLGLISSELRDCDFDIAFVPWPKADDTQEDYITCTSNAYSLWTIPLSAADPDMSAAVMENMAFEGFINIMPAMFETAYKVKYNNTESQLQSQVFDILRENLTFDIGRIMGGISSDIFSLFPNAIINGKNNLSSTFEKIRTRASKSLADFMDEIDAAD